MSIVACWFCQDISNFLTVSISCSCQINLDTLFLTVILCSIESNFVRNSPNEPLCYLVQNKSHSQITLKTSTLKIYIKQLTRLLSIETNFYEIPMFVKLINPSVITNRILCGKTVTPPPQIRPSIFQTEWDNV